MRNIFYGLTALFAARTIVAEFFSPKATRTDTTIGGRDVNEHKLAHGIGWVSIGVGTALVVTPTRMTKGFGMGERPNLGRFLGIRDLILGAGLLRSESRASSWLHARAISDAADAALLIGGAVSGAFPRGQAMVGLTVATTLSVLSFVLARRLK